MFKKKKKKAKPHAGEGGNEWMDQELTDDNQEQINNVLTIMKRPCVFIESRPRSKENALGKDTEVELQLDPTASRITIQPPGKSDSKKSKSLAQVGVRPHLTTVFLVDILDFVRGQSLFRKKKKLEQFKSLSMTIVFSAGGSSETSQVDLYADPQVQGEVELLAWRKGLAYLMKNAVTNFEVNPMPILLEKAWLQVGGGPGLSVNINAVDMYFRQNNMVARKKDLKKGFAEADSDGSGKLEQYEFTKVVITVQQGSFLQTIYDQITKSKRIKADTLLQFQQEIQKDEMVTREECMKHIRKMTGASAGFQFDDFCTYLTSSKLNSAIHPRSHEVYQNMNYPFAHYYISTTRVPADMIIETCSLALMEGCRAFHVEIYAQGGEPSLNKPGVFAPSRSSEAQVEVTDWLSHLRDKAFTVSKYPIIIVFELHCRKESVHDKLAAMLKTYLGFGLSKDAREMTPESCKERFLVAVDMSHVLEGETTTVSRELQDLCTFEFEPFKNGLVSMSKKFEASKRNAGKQMTIMKDYQLGLNLERDYFALFNEKFLSYWVPKNERVNVYSCEAWAAGVQLVGINYYSCKKNKGQNNEEIQEDMQRVAQLGRFAQNGRCGYVLKPHGQAFCQKLTTATLRTAHVLEYERIRKERRARMEKLKDAALGSNATDLQEEKDPQEADDFLDFMDGTGSCIVKVRLISGHRLPRLMAEISSVFVHIKVVGHVHDEKDYRSRVVDENGYKPEWDDTFEFTLAHKEFDVICFKVYEKGVVEDYLLCQAAIPIPCLRQGYRNVELRDADGRRISSQPTLFLQILQEACGDFQSLKLQEAAFAEREVNLEEQRERMEQEYENVRNAIDASTLKQMKLIRDARHHRQKLTKYDEQRILGFWINQEKIRELFGTMAAHEDDDCEEETKEAAPERRRMVFDVQEELPFDEPQRGCDCLIS